MSTTQDKINQILALRQQQLDPTAAMDSKPAANAKQPSTSSSTAPNQGVVGRVVSDVGQGLRDAPNAIWRGISGALNEADQTANSAVNWIAKELGVSAPGYFQIGGNSDGSFIHWYSGERKRAQLIGDPLIPTRSESTTGQLIENAAQFGTGMMLLGKVLKAGGASFATKVLTSAVKGGVVDATMFDTNTKRLSNLLQDHPSLANPVSAYLASNEDDGVLKSKFKAAVEGTLTGTAFETFFQGLRLLKKTRLLSDTPSAAAKADLTATVDDAQAAIDAADKATPFKVVDSEKGPVIQGKNGSVSEPYKDAATAHSDAATLNTLAEESQKPTRIQLTPEQAQAQREEVKRLLTSTDPADIQRLAEGTDFNFPVTYKTTLEDVKANIEAMSSVASDVIQEHRGEPVLSYDKLVNQLQNFYPNDDPNKIIAAASKLHGDALTLPARMQWGLVEVQRAANRVAKLSAQADGAPDNALIMDQLRQALNHHLQVQAYVKGASTNVARALQIHKNDVTSVLEDLVATPNGGDSTTKEVAQAVNDSLAGMSADDMREAARRVRLAGNDPKAITAAIQTAPRSAMGQAMAVHNEYWINSMLSGIQTYEVNFMNNMINTFVAPVERFNAGLVSRDPALMREGIDLVVGNVYSIMDSLRAGAKALRAGHNLLDATSSIADGAVPTGEIGGYLGKLIRMPSRFLMSADEFAKQMSYRSNVRAQALREARDLLASGQKVNVGQYVSDAMNAAFNPSGKGINKAALAYAAQNTFTTNLDPNSIAGYLSKMSQANPVVKLVLPFIKVPANLAYWTWERTPLLRQLNTSVRAELAAGGERAAIQQAKLGTGLALYSTGAALTAAGIITGHGPMDPNLRKEWLESHQPYSIKIGDSWYSYRRLDPFATPIGIIADLMQMSGEHSDLDIEHLVLNWTAAMANNLASKTYLEGIVNAMDTFTSGDANKWQKLAQTQAGSYVPNFLNQINPDPTFHEVRGIVDAMMARTPGMSAELPPRRNIFQEPVLKAPGWITRAFNPFTQMKAGGPVEDKLLEIGKAIPMPSKFAPQTDGVSAIDLTSTKYGLKGSLTPYDRMREIMAEPGNMPSLREAMTKLVSSEAWDRMSPGTDVYPGGMRFEAANKLMQRYRQVAWARTLQEFPALRQAWQQERITKQVAKVRGQVGVDQITSLFNKGPNP